MKKLILPAALVLLVVAAPALEAASDCSNSTIKGVYGLLGTGIILGPPTSPAPFLGPFARVGRVVADGAGNISISGNANYNGSLIDESFSGTYTVGADCTVVLSPLVPIPVDLAGTLVPVPFQFTGAVADNGNEVALVLCGVGAPCGPGGQTGNVIRVILSRNRVNVVPCTNRSLSDAFQLDMSGVVIGPPAAPFASEGRLVFDGQGGFTGKAVSSSAGSIENDTLAGTYAVDAGCNVVLTFSSPGTLNVWKGTVTGPGDGANLIVSQAGVVIAGTLKKQAPTAGNGGERGR